MSKNNIDNKLIDLGFVYNVISGFQIDLNTVSKPFGDGFTEGHYCDHNCTLDCGNYDCPAAFTHNKNIKVNTLISIHDIEKTLVNAHKGLIETNQQFLNKIYPKYCQDYKIPDKVRDQIELNLNSRQLEINLFGGNPELHPEFFNIIKLAKKIGWKITITTTGKKFLHDTEFVNNFKKSPPDLLACSADDFDSLEELERLVGMSLNELKMYWQKANPLYGQRKKAYESIYVAKLNSVLDFCPMMFNTVVHPGNINRIIKILHVLESYFPKVKLNPYPAQASFEYNDVDWTNDDLDKLETFIDFMISKQLSQSIQNFKSYVPRLPYWLALKSVFNTIKDKMELKHFISGNDIWKCYRRQGAGRYLQVSCARIFKSDIFKVGGHPGCFWNECTVTDEKQQLWNMDAKQIKDFMIFEKNELAKKAIKACPGCIMPRLLFDGVNIELGLNTKFLPAYLKLRKQYFNF